MQDSKSVGQANGSIAASRIQVSINSVTYHLVPHNSKQALNCFQPQIGYTPVTVVQIAPGSTVDRQFLEQHKQDITADKDDVWQPEFYSNILVCTADSHNAGVDKTDLANWHSNGGPRVEIASNDSSRDLAPGPYLAGQGQVWEPWRVYNDTANAMMLTFAPSVGNVFGSWQAHDSCYETGGTQCIVPSRLYYTKTNTKPLAGMRFAVKDCFDVKGFKSSLGSRAWLEYHEPATQNAACVQRLLDLGAILIGKAKLAHWIIRERPAECVDFSAPFNPRGDGYLDAGESSHGNAAAIATYDWLDFSIATDATGSVRLPAHLNGIHSIRIGQGAVSKEGVMGCYAMFDAPAVFTRSIGALEEIMAPLSQQEDAEMDGMISRGSRHDSVASVPIPGTPNGIYNGTNPTVMGRRGPHSVIVPTDYLTDLSEQQKAMIHSVADGIANAAGIPKRVISIAEAWDQDRPDSTVHAPVKSYLEEVGSVPYFVGSCKKFQAFRDAYHKRTGRLPYMNREVQWRMQRIAKYSEEDVEKLMERLLLYKAWLLEKMFDTSAENSTGAVIVIPVESGAPMYRDDIPGIKTIFGGFDNLTLSPITGTPEVTVIAGEIPYTSRISGREEHHPYGVSIIGRPGSDVALCRLAACAMKQAKLPLELATGRSIYSNEHSSS